MRKAVLFSVLFQLFTSSLFLEAAPPPTPTSLSVKPSTGVVGLNWADVSGATSYNIYRSTASNGTYTLIGTATRSRFLDKNASAGTEWHYRVSALNAGLEESGFATGSATPDNLSINRPAVRGNYRVGSSFVVDSDRLKPLLESRGVFVSTYRRQIIGAGIEYIWSDTLNNRPAEHEQHVAVLQNAGYDVLVLNAQTLWAQPTREMNGTLYWAVEALAANPDYRVFIHQYWTREEAGNEWDETINQPENSLRLFWLAALRNAYLVGEQIGVPVYVAPFGYAIQDVKAVADAGLLENYDSRDDLHPDGSHLTNFGKYVQEGVVMVGAYQKDIRGATRFVDNQTQLSVNDAEVVQQIIYQTVRETPFSGWYENAPTTFAGHQAALLEAMNTWEDFTNFTTNGSGSWVGRTGRTWNYQNAQTVNSGLERQIQINVGGWIETTLQKGLLNALWRMRKEGSGNCQLSVKANGVVVGSVDYNSNELWGRQVRNIDLGGTVVFRLENTGTSAVRIDDLMWDETGTSGNGVEIITQNVAPLIINTAVDITIKAFGGTAPLSFSVTSGQLPPGITLTAAGHLIGTPNTKGTYKPEITVQDSGNPATSFSRIYNIAVVDPTTITQQPQSATVSFGDTIVLSVAASGDQLSYRWFYNGTPIADTNSAELAIPGAGPLNEGTYRVEVKGLGGTVISNEVTVTVTNGDAFILSTSMQDTNRDLSGNVFDLTNTGSNPIILTGRMTGNFDVETGLVMSAWYRNGSSEGLYSSSAGWMQWGVSTPFTGNGYGVETPYDLNASITIAPGQTVGIYLLLTTKQSNLAYRAVSSNQTYSRGDLLFTPKIGLGGGTAFGTAQLFGGPNARRSYSGSIEFTVDTTPQISALLPAAGTVGQTYLHTFRRQGGNGSVTWSLTTGSVPPGLTLNLQTQELSGRPTTAGSYSFTLRTEDADGDQDTRVFNIEIGTSFTAWLAEKELPLGSDPFSDPWNEGASLLMRHALGLPTGQGVASSFPMWIKTADPGALFQYRISRDRSAIAVILVQTSENLTDWNTVYESAPEGELFDGAELISRETFPETTIEYINLRIPMNEEVGEIYVRTVVEEWAP